jgi:TRAP-type uncharacterized transport system fused permease subunit
VQLCILAVAVGAFAQAVLTTNLASGIYQLFEGTIVSEHMILALLVTMVISLIMGMGMPTPLAYVIVVLTIGLVLRETGLDLMAVHFFCLYFAVFSTITPPIAVGVMAACKIANSDFWRTCLESMKLAGVTFFIPFAFSYSTVLLDFPRLSLQMLIPSLEILLLTYIYASSVYGYALGIGRLNTTNRIICGFAAMGGCLAVVNPGNVLYLLIFLGLTTTSIILSAIQKKLVPRLQE